MVLGVLLGLEVQDARIGDADTHRIPSDLAETPDTGVTPSLLNDKDGNPIRTDRSLDKMRLTSMLKNSVWKELEQFEVEGDTGFVSFKTVGFARYSSPESRSGSVIVVCELSSCIFAG